MKVFKCPICGNVIELLDGDISKIKCCNVELQEEKANVVDASTEKHVPSYEIKGDMIEVQVGEVEHPMTQEHYIMWIALVSGNKMEKVLLTPDDKPVAKFHYEKDAEIYAYCNLHGLWKVKVMDN